MPNHKPVPVVVPGEIVQRFKDLALEIGPGFRCVDAVKVGCWSSFIERKMRMTFNDVKRLAGLRIRRDRLRSKTVYEAKEKKTTKTKRVLCLGHCNQYFNARVYGPKEYDRVCDLCRNINNHMRGIDT